MTLAFVDTINESNYRALRNDRVKFFENQGLYLSGIDGGLLDDDQVPGVGNPATGTGNLVIGHSPLDRSRVH